MGRTGQHPFTDASAYPLRSKIYGAPALRCLSNLDHQVPSWGGIHERGREVGRDEDRVQEVLNVNTGQGTDVSGKDKNVEVHSMVTFSIF